MKRKKRNQRSANELCVHWKMEFLEFLLAMVFICKLGYLRLFIHPIGIHIVFLHQLLNYFNVSNRFHRHFHLFQPDFDPFSLMYICLRFCLKRHNGLFPFSSIVFFLTFASVRKSSTWNFWLHNSSYFVRIQVCEVVLPFHISFNFIYTSLSSIHSICWTTISPKQKKENTTTT